MPKLSTDEILKRISEMNSPAAKEDDIKVAAPQNAQLPPSLYKLLPGTEVPRKPAPGTHDLGLTAIFDKASVRAGVELTDDKPASVKENVPKHVPLYVDGGFEPAAASGKKPLRHKSGIIITESTEEFDVNSARFNTAPRPVLKDAEFVRGARLKSEELDPIPDDFSFAMESGLSALTNTDTYDLSAQNATNEYDAVDISVSDADEIHKGYGNTLDIESIADTALKQAKAQTLPEPNFSMYTDELYVTGELEKPEVPETQKQGHRLLISEINPLDSLNLGGEMSSTQPLDDVREVLEKARGKTAHGGGRQKLPEMLENLKKNGKEQTGNAKAEEPRKHVTKTHSPLNIDYKNQIVEPTASIDAADNYERNYDVDDTRTISGAENVKKPKPGRRANPKLRSFFFDHTDGIEYIDESGGSADGDTHLNAGKKESNDEGTRKRLRHKDAVQIWDSLENIRKDTKFQMLVLAAVTLVLLGLSVINDLTNIEMSFYLLGHNFLLLDKGLGTVNYIILCAVLTAFAAYVSRHTIQDGILAVFSAGAGRGGSCLTALTVIGTLIAAAACIIDFDLVQRGYVFLYMPFAAALLFMESVRKLLVIDAAMRDFHTVYGDNKKYYAHVLDKRSADILTRAQGKNSDRDAKDEKARVISTIGKTGVTMRKTEFLSGFLKHSIADDDIIDVAGRQTAIFAIFFALFTGLIAYFFPYPETVPAEFNRNSSLAFAAFSGALCACSGFSFLLSGALTRARVSKDTCAARAAVPGYGSARKFAGTSVAALPASALFPAGSVRFVNMKPCRTEGQKHDISVDEALIIAASISLASGSIMSDMFYDITSGRDILVQIDECFYEANFGVIGWLGTRRVLLGNAEHMKHHGIPVPDTQRLRKRAKTQTENADNNEIVYLAVSGEVVAALIIEITVNKAIMHSLQSLVRNKIGIVVETRDSIITADKIADAFELPAEMVKVMPPNFHEKFEEQSSYTSSGDCSVSCDGTLSSFAAGITGAKRILRGMSISLGAAIFGSALTAVLFLVFTVFNAAVTPAHLISFGLVWLFITAQLGKGASHK